MHIQPRSYQTECVSAIYNFFQNNVGNPVCALPTGTGKSVVIAMFLESVFRQYLNQRILVLTHVKELVGQNYEKLLSLWPQAPAGINSAGLNRRDWNKPIIFAGIGSVVRRWEQLGRIDLIIIDEAHLVSPNEETMYLRLISALMTLNPYLRVIGFTATPWRLGHGKLIDPYEKKGLTVQPLFTDICFDITGLAAFNRLIAEGFLSPVVPKNTSTLLDTDGVHMRGGDFIQSQLQIAVNRDDITASALREAMELGYDRRHWLVFASGIEHAVDVNDMLNSFGVPSVVIHSKMSNGERDQAILDFKSGKYRAAVNNNVLTTGFDFPAIDLILMLRPTASPVLWVQMLGRGTRPSPETGKENCLVLDFAGNTRRLGPINDPVIPQRRGKKQGSAPVRLCESCATWNHASVRHCVQCGTEFPVQVKLQQEASTKELIKGDMPIVEVFKVDHMTYVRHVKQDRPPMVRVTYYCGYKMFQEFVCIEHENFAGRKARQWWKTRSELPFPLSTAEALEKAEHLKTPTHIRVWINKRYPEILAFCYDGTAFGMEQVPEVLELPTVESDAWVVKAKEAEEFGAALNDDSEYEDDIPF